MMKNIVKRGVSEHCRMEPEANSSFFRVVPSLPRA